MALLFKVWTANRQTKALIVLKTEENLIQNLIKKASEKLGIHGQQLVLESDGTEVDDDEVALLIRKEPLLVLQINEKWVNIRSLTPCTSSDLTTSDSETAELDYTLISEQTEGDDVENTLTNEPPEAGPAIVSEERMETIVQTIVQVDNNMEVMWSKFQIPWNKLTSDILSACAEGKRKKEIITHIVHLVVNEMRNIKPHPPAKAVKITAQLMVQKYPRMFQDIDDDGVIIGDGLITIYNKLYERISYLNRPHKRSTSTEGKLKRKLVNAVAGCSNWNPVIEDTDQTGEDDHETIKRRLQEATNIESLDQVPIKDLEMTYGIQREFINRPMPPTIKEIRNDWPILLNKHVLLWHFQKCTNNGINQFETSFNSKIEKIIDMDNSGLNLLNEERQLTTLKVLCHQFKEELNELYRTFEDIENIGFQPCVVQMESGTLQLFFEKERLFDVEHIAEGLKMMFAVYFVFNIQYPAKSSCVLEFLQRYFFKIHPDQGSKSKKVKSSKRKVVTFLNKLNKTTD